MRDTQHTGSCKSVLNSGFELSALVCIVLFLAGLLGVFLSRAYNLCGYPYPLENGEGICVHMAQLLSQGRLYKDLDSFPLIVANYPPVYFFLLLIIPSPDMFFSGRILSFASVIGIASIVYGIIRSQNGSIWGALLGTTVVLMFPWVNKGGIICRVDMIAVFFSLFGFFCIIKTGKLWRIFGIVFFLAALFTKHSVWAAPIAGFVYLFIVEYEKKNIREAVMLFLLFLGSGILLFTIGIVLTQGEFYRHLITYNVYSFSAQRVFGYSQAFAKEVGFLWILAIPAAFNRTFWKSPVAFYFITGLCSLILRGREGSSDHYFLEATCAVALVCGLSVTYIPKGIHNALVKFVYIAILGLNLFVHRELFSVIRVSPQVYQITKLAVERIREVKGPVLAEDTGLLLAADKTVYVHPFAITQLIQKGILDPSLLYNALGKKYFAAVVLNSKLAKLNYVTVTRFSSEMLWLINENYVFDSEFGQYCIYRRK